MTNKEKKKKKRGGATRGQLALIGVLSIVLVFVIVAQLPSSSPPKRSRPRVAARSEVSQTVKSIAPTCAGSCKKTHRQWPQVSLREIAGFDPLAEPGWYLDAVTKRNQQPGGGAVQEVSRPLVLEELQREGATIVLIDGQKRIATVGEQRIRVGDKIDGYQVSEITEKGVILTKSRSR